MSVRTTGKSFHQQHWDWLVAGGGLLVALAVVFIALNRKPVDQTNLTPHAGAKIEAADLTAFDTTFAGFKDPAGLSAIDPKAGSFLQPGERLFCKSLDDSDADHPGCGCPLPPGLDQCFKCGAKLKKNEVEIVAEKETEDTDGDGLPDVFENQYGLDANKNDADEDKDGDGFTNAEEFAAKTAPNDPKSHPEYLDANFFEVSEPETVDLDLAFVKHVWKLPNRKDKLEFYVSGWDRKNIDCRGTFQVVVGDEIKASDMNMKIAAKLKTGFKLVACEGPVKREVKRAGQEKPIKIDVYTAVIERIKDGKRFTLEDTNGEKKVVKTPVDIRVKIGVKTVQPEGVAVSEKDEIDLSRFGATYVVEKIERVKKNGSVVFSVTVINKETGAKKTFEVAGAS